MQTISTNINQAIADFKNIKDKIIECGVNIADGTPTSEYATKVNEVFEAGKAQGGGDGAGLFYYASRLNNAFGGVDFPEDTNFVLTTKNIIDCGYMFNNSHNLKTVKLVNETLDTVLNMTAFCAIGNNSTPYVEMVDLSGFNKQYNATRNMFAFQAKLKSIIGAMDLTYCTDALHMFRNNFALEDVEFVEGTISVSIDLKSCSSLSAESLHSIVKGLSDTVSGQTLTLTKESTIRTTFDAVYGEGAWDTLVASKSNWTIAYN